MCTKKWPAAAVMAGMALLPVLARSQPGLPPVQTMPPVTARGVTVDGVAILCRGIECADILHTMQLSSPYPPNTASMGDEDIPVDGNQFCAVLKNNKPSGCSYSNPPASPGISVPGQPAYKPNGCGTGKMANVFADVFLEIATRPTYSGDLQAPYPGVSFREACNGHDICWATGSPNSKSSCDYAFRADMITACGGDSAANNVCIGFSGLYHGAVSNSGPAQSAYNSSQADRVCALWASDMRENACQ